jgi:hypothetical protein
VDGRYGCFSLMYFGVQEVRAVGALRRGFGMYTRRKKGRQHVVHVLLDVCDDHRKRKSSIVIGIRSDQDTPRTKGTTPAEDRIKARGDRKQTRCTNNLAAFVQPVEQLELHQ